MTPQEILTTYWSQTILILGFITYFIQKIYDSRLKKVESRHSLFQEYKINTIMKFLSTYAKVEQTWQHIPHLGIIENKFTAKEIDAMIWPLMNELQGTKNELFVFLDETEVLLFEDIISSILKLHTNIYSLYSNTFELASIISTSNEFHSLRSKSFKENKDRILEIGKMTRKMFNS